MAMVQTLLTSHPLLRLQANVRANFQRPLFFSPRPLTLGGAIFFAEGLVAAIANLVDARVTARESQLKWRLDTLSRRVQNATTANLPTCTNFTS